MLNSFDSLPHSSKQLTPEIAKTHVETDRSAMEAVFNSLKDAGYEVWLNPSEDITYKYIDFKKPVIIVKALVTEAPTEKIDGINVPTIEKLLVDIKKDEDFVNIPSISNFLGDKNSFQ